MKEKLLALYLKQTVELRALLCAQFTAILWAAENDPAIVRLLLKQIDFDCCDDTGRRFGKETLKAAL